MDEQARARAEKNFKKQQVQTEREKVWADYQAEQQRIDQNTAKLRAARLARENNHPESAKKKTLIAPSTERRKPVRGKSRRSRLGQ
jgi:hypothetical protein